MVLAMALELVDDFDENAYVAVNVGPGALRAEDIPVLLAAVNGHRVVLELTEHVPVDDYRTLQDALSAVRGSGARLAIDDTGAGFASLVHILNLGPDIIKLDRSITRGVDRDPVRSALASALVSFAAEIGAEVTAEGIETQAELDTVRALGIRHGQGYLLGMPTPIAAQARRVQDASRVRTSSEPTRGHASRTR
jgi:EAL domain-containing protein (putative c-di-GMP-specific phosphodiesterase class I)